MTVRFPYVGTAVLISLAVTAAGKETSTPLSLTPEQRIVHVLNRLGFGPRPGDLDKVRAVGLDAYVSAQLNPSRIDDSDLDRRLEQLETVRMSSSELADLFRKQRSPDGAMDQRRGSLRRIAVELSQAKLLRAVYSERQLQEVMADFWYNHFNVFLGKGADRVLTTEYDRDVIRPHALGRFRELLGATAKSPAMLFYLDNWLSSTPDGGAGARRPAVPRRPRGLNENYARELLELHTLGVDGGYSQKDVNEVARCLTGWTIRNPRQGGGFLFAPRLHDNGEKTVLGHRIAPGGGQRDGEMVLDRLAEHPSTAGFISLKLCRRFVSDDPPAALVKRCARAFLSSHGEIRQVLATIFSSPEFYSAAAYRAKLKKPFELVASALRATGAQTTAPPRLLVFLRAMGEPLYACQPPTGYPDTADAWTSSGALLERVKFAAALAQGRLPGTDVPDRTPAETPDDWLRPLAQSMLFQPPPDALVQTIRTQLASSGNGAPGHARAAVALILGSPEFQRR